MKRTIYTCMISTILATGLWSFKTRETNQVEGTPLYMTDITFLGKNLLTSEKVRKQSVFIHRTEKNESKFGKQKNLPQAL